MSEGPEITFAESASERIVEVFGWEVDDQGWIIDPDGEHVLDTKDRAIRLDDLGGIVKDENGDPVPIRDNFNDIVDYVERTENR